MEKLTSSQLIEQYNDGRRDFSNVDLSRVYVTGYKDQYIDLSGINLKGSKLYRARFEFVNLKHADFTNARLSGRVFVDCNLRGAYLGCDLMDTIFLQCDMRFANLQSSTLNKTQFKYCDLRRSNFSTYSPDKYRQPEIDLWFSDIKYANFAQVDLWLSKLTGVKGLYSFLDYGFSDLPIYCIKQANTWQIIHSIDRCLVRTSTLYEFEEETFYTYGHDRCFDNVPTRKLNVELLRALL